MALSMILMNMVGYWIGRFTKRLPDCVFYEELNDYFPELPNKKALDPDLHNQWELELNTKDFRLVQVLKAFLYYETGQNEHDDTEFVRPKRCGPRGGCGRKYATRDAMYQEVFLEVKLAKKPWRVMYYSKALYLENEKRLLEKREQKRKRRKENDDDDD